MICQQQYEWIKLDVIYKMFPNLTGIIMESMNLAPAVIQNLLFYLSHIVNSPLEEIIITYNSKSTVIDDYSKFFLPIGFKMVKQNVNFVAKTTKRVYIYNKLRMITRRPRYPGFWTIK
eukprot:295821_1